MENANLSKPANIQVDRRMPDAVAPAALPELQLSEFPVVEKGSLDYIFQARLKGWPESMDPMWWAFDPEMSRVLAGYDGGVHFYQCVGPAQVFMKVPVPVFPVAFALAPDFEFADGSILPNDLLIALRNLGADV